MEYSYNGILYNNKKHELTLHTTKNESFTFKVEWQKPEQVYKVWFHLNEVQNQAKWI